MRKFASLITVVFLAVFAASTILHAVSASAMAMADGGATPMADCQGCPEDGDSNTNASCDLVCTAPLIAVLKGPVAELIMISLLRQDRTLGMNLPRGLRAPPDPFPPRHFI